MTSGSASSVPLARGNNTLTITYVRSGVTTTYYIYISRDGQFSNFQLSSNSLTLTPAWSPSVHYYQISDVSYATTTIDYVVTESYDEPGHLECDHCDWWQYHGRGTQHMTLTAGANCIRWSHYAGPGYNNNPEYYYIAVNRGAPGTAPTGLCDPSTATTTTTTTSTTSTTSTSTTTTVPTSTSTTVVSGGSNGGGGTIPNSPVTTVAQGQSEVATIAPGTTVAVLKASTAANSSTSSSTSTSSTSTTVPELVTTKSTAGKPAPSVETLTKGEVALTIGGKKASVSVNRSANQLILNGGGITLTVSALSKDNVRVPLDGTGSLRFKSTDKVVVKAEGIAPAEDVSMWIFSTPTELGTVKSNASGHAEGTFVLPSKIEDGSHRLVLQGKNADGEPAVLGIGVTVGVAKKTSTLSRVLIAIPIAFAIGFGILLPTQARRRRRRASSAA
jgi:hypothetical protein